MLNKLVIRSIVTVAAAAAVVTTAPGIATAAPKGPDVSSWQHIDATKIDWAQVKGAGHDFAMVKATQSLDYMNPFFIEDSIVMRAAGVARGAYHYADPSQSPELQAAYYSAMVLGINGYGDLPPVLDLEDTGGLDAPALIDWTHRYLNGVQALTGRVPIIYTYPNFWRTAMADSNAFTRYPLWIADYNGKDAPGPLPGGWPAWTFWQYTDSGSIPGIGAHTDINVYSGAQGDFRRYANS